MAPKKIACGSLFLLLGTICWLNPASGQPQATRPQEGSLEPFLGEPQFEMQQVFLKERHPNVAVARDGTVLVTLGNTSLLVRRSEDGGKTWGAPITIAKPGFQGGGLTVDETSGDVLAFAEAKHPPPN